jgi:tetratricopeptide (TPR) repeat protein
VRERIARHLVQAGDLEGALPHLLGAALEAGRSAGYADAHALLGERDAVLERLGLPETDQRRVEGWAIKASVLVDEGRYDEAGMWADLVLLHRDKPELARMMPTALRVRADMSMRQARLDEAAARFREAVDAAQAANEHVELIQSLAGLADAAYYRGRLAESNEYLTRALDVCTKSGDDVGVAFILWNSAYTALWLGQLDSAK